jgi:uncharacterized protein YfaP (DUF2135 family)
MTADAMRANRKGLMVMYYNYYGKKRNSNERLKERHVSTLTVYFITKTFFIVDGGLYLLLDSQ